MKSALDALMGLQLESCRFGLGFYDFAFDGTVDGEQRRYIVSTQYHASSMDGARADAEQSISTHVWPILGRTLARVRVEELPDANQVLVEFDGGLLLRVWQARDVGDNLLVVTERFSDEWFTVL